jgi:predicted aminopeptidase
MRRVLRIIAASLVALSVLVGVAAAVNADVRFLLRAAYEEARILLRRRPLENLIADQATPPARRARFPVVLSARAYGADSLGLKVGKTYTSYVDVGRDTLVLVLSASPRFALADHTWWFPIVGAVPYHGYFSLRAARDEMRRLDRAGLDTYLRPAGAFSTLGWFGDPIFSTALSRDSSQLVETVLHEVTHNTIWVPSSADFNESLAMFMGHRGAERFFRSRGETALADRTAARWEDEKALGDFYTRLAGSLDSLYRSGVDTQAMNTGREEVFRRAREIMASSLRGKLRDYPVDWLLEQPLNNATVVAARVYRTRLDLFDRVFESRGRDLRETLRVIVEVVRSKQRDPYAAVEGLVAPAIPAPIVLPVPPKGKKRAVTP